MFKASAAQVDLNPAVGSWMTGFAARTVPTTGMHDPIMAHAVLLDDGKTRLAIVACDVIGFTPAAIADMRHRIAKKSAVPPVNILISCTHTHSGPVTMPFRGVMGRLDHDWLAEAQHKIVDLVVGLHDDLKPALFAHAAATVTGIGYNRQDQTHNPDDEIVVVAIDGAGDAEGNVGEPIATLINYATHPVVLGPSNLQFSADFPGELARCIASQRGGICLYLQGACGDSSRPWLGQRHFRRHARHRRGAGMRRDRCVTGCAAHRRGSTACQQQDARDTARCLAHA